MNRKFKDIEIQRSKQAGYESGAVTELFMGNVNQSLLQNIPKLIST